MKTGEFSDDVNNPSEDWSDDPDFDQEDNFADFDAEDDDSDIDSSEGDLRISTRRISGLKKGLCARRMIEQIKERNALDRELNDYADFDYLN